MTASLSMCFWIPKIIRKPQRQPHIPLSKTLKLVTFWVSKKFFAFVFAVLYLVFVIIFGKTLEKWDNDKKGRCYRSDRIAHPNASHPYVDMIYLITTSVCLFVILLGCLVSKVAETILNVEEETLWSLRGTLLVFALLQYPLHLYMAVAIRITNEGSLRGDIENKWSFGQIMTMLLLASFIKTCATTKIGTSTPRNYDPELSSTEYNQERDAQ